MNPIVSVIEKVKEVGYNRCGNCPAFWHSVDHWGEHDEGCSLHRDISDFCSLSLMPKFAVKTLIHLEERRMDKFYEQHEKEMIQDEHEMECMQKALVNTLEVDQLELCWQGKKVDVDYRFAYELLNEFRKLRDSAIESTESTQSEGR